MIARGRSVARSARTGRRRLGSAVPRARPGTDRRRGHQRRACRCVPRAPSPAVAGHRGGARRSRKPIRRRSCWFRREAHRSTWRVTARRRWPSFARWVKQSVRARQLRRPRSHCDRRAPAAALCVCRARNAAICRHPVPDVRCAAARRRAVCGRARPGVLPFVSSNFARVPAIALLRSPHFGIPPPDPDSPEAEGPLPEIAALDRALSDAGYLGDHRGAGSHRWNTGETPGLRAASARARAAPRRRWSSVRASCCRCACRHRVPITSTRLLTFLTSHERLPAPADPLRARQLRARAAILGTLVVSPRRLSAVRCRADRVRRHGGHRSTRGSKGRPSRRAQARRACTSWTPRARGLATSTRVQLAGLVDGEWPERPRRNIFYSAGLLRDLGWTAESERLDGARAAFADLLKLAQSQVLVSGFLLEDDAVVAPSTLLDEVEAAGLAAVEWVDDRTRIFEYEALGFEPLVLDALALTRAGDGALPAAGAAGDPRAVSRIDRGSRCGGTLAERARAVPGLPLQVLRCGRLAARGNA